MPAMTGDGSAAIIPCGDRSKTTYPEIAIVEILEAIELTTPNSKLLVILARKEFWKGKKGNLCSRNSKLTIVVSTTTNLTGMG